MVTKKSVVIKSSCTACAALLQEVNKIEGSPLDNLMDVLADIIDYHARSRDTFDCLICWLSKVAEKAKTWRKRMVDKFLQKGDVYRAVRAVITSQGGIGPKKFLHYLKLFLHGTEKEATSY